jgi:hypothetical protein
VAGISPIVTRGFLFTPSLVVTAGYISPGAVALSDPLYTLIAETKHFVEIAETKHFVEIAETKLFTLIAKRNE